ncbi:P-loop containing nucleoside triphosphate hydrolase protein [Mycena olivaceomarginata]|nr:P-loop containing nucleoside triphosphate hydrolase protein [Mycena olivaceomarginata]
MAITQPTKFKVSQFAALQQTSISLRPTAATLLHHITSIRRLTQMTKNFYNILDTPAHGTSTEAIPYPNPGHSIEAPAGASLELRQPQLRPILRNIHFEYPSSQSRKKALTNVSFKIKPGSIVVIVGENRSGKSTLISLLSRQNSPTSGSIILDDRPIEDYEDTGLQQATAVLNQTQWLYPLSLRENIGLGNADRAWSDEAVVQAARKGGSYDFISRLEDQFETILYLAQPPMAGNIPQDDPNGPENILKSELQSDISGGERRRVSIAALDPAAEQHIFQNLLAERAGKTHQEKPL